MQLQPLDEKKRSGERRRKLGIALASDAREVEEAQRLRYRVFGEEMGARLDAARCIDRDAFDAYCEHLLVRDLDSAEVVGTYRMLPPDAARAAGSYYSEQEFDISRIAHLRDGLVEIGRSCVHPDYRNGAVILLLWSALLRYMMQRRHTHLFGCASISMADGGHDAALLWRRIESRHLAPAEYRVFPHCRLPVEKLEAGQSARRAPGMPPLIRGYLNAGAQVCGEPAWDPDFNTADIPVLLSINDMNIRHQKHFGANVIS
jgi:putative hemolysin